MLLAACGQKKASEQQTPDGTEASVQNTYDYLNPTHGEQTAKAEDLSGKVIALTADEFLDRITDIDPAKGLRYKGTTPCMSISMPTGAARAASSRPSPHGWPKSTKAS